MTFLSTQKKCYVEKKSHVKIKKELNDSLSKIKEIDAS